MTVTPESAEARASREASAWLIELQEDPGDADARRRLGEWIAASAENARAWAAVRHLSQVARAMTPGLASEWRPALEQVRETDATRVEAPPRRLIGRHWRKGAVVLALAACIALVAGPGLLIRLQADIMTETAETRRLDLPDGSQVTLAAGSAASIDFAGSNRRVQLLKGEAFFQVVPDGARPFRVVADDVETTVLGTSFDVRRDSSGVTVNVEEGRVSVASGSAGAEVLGAGDSVSVPWKGDAVRSTVPQQLIAPWRTGQLVLHDRPLREAIDQLRRYYNGVIVLASEELARKPVTGAYNLRDPEDALRGMARAHNATVRKVSPWIVVISAE